MMQFNASPMRERGIWESNEIAQRFIDADALREARREWEREHCLPAPQAQKEGSK